jgi:hypothetical protein
MPERIPATFCAAFRFGPSVTRSLRAVLPILRALQKAGNPLWAGWPLTIHMPCGEDFVIQGPDDFPLRTVPCLCQNPAHFFVLWHGDP